MISSTFSSVSPTHVTNSRYVLWEIKHYFISSWLLSEARKILTSSSNSCRMCMCVRLYDDAWSMFGKNAFTEWMGMHFQLFLATSFNFNTRKASKIPFHWVWNMECCVYLASKLQALSFLTCRLQHTSLHKIRRKRIPLSAPKKVKKWGGVETAWMNKWFLHQQNNGQSRWGDSWHMRRAPSHLAALLSFHFSSCRLVSPHVFLFTMTRPANNSVTVKGERIKVRYLIVDSDCHFIHH